MVILWAVPCIVWWRRQHYIMASKNWQYSFTWWKHKWQRNLDCIQSMHIKNCNKNLLLYCFVVLQVLRGHKEDVYDLCWSPDSLKLLSGSIDNTAILWDVTKGVLQQILKDHKGFVQVCPYKISVLWILLLIFS